MFAGIGGFELGLAQSGHHAELVCDILPAARSVLRHRFPDVEYRDDITKLRSLPAAVDLVCAGFPCQDLSQAGRTAGLAGEKSGLIGEVFRLLSRRRVGTVVIENVPFMLQLGGGNAMRAIADEFERRGYRWAYRVVDSWSFGLPQRRERVFFVASRELDPSGVLFADDAPIERPKTDLVNRAHGFYWTEGKGGLGWAVDAVPTLKNGSTIGIASPPAILLPGGRLIRPSIQDAERMQGFASDWTIAAEEVAKPAARWGLIGSAVSVPITAWIGRRLVDPGRPIPFRVSVFPSSGKAPRAAAWDGTNRVAVDVGTDPIGLRPTPLLQFLGDPSTREPLSAKATAGFLARTREAKLRFEPGFIEAVERHLADMGGVPIPSKYAKQLSLLAA